nr:hypothetical protein [Tanacetum cinerariifolium]
MDPTPSLGRICLGENVYGSSSEKVEGHGDWNALEYTDTTGSKEKMVTKALSFYKMETYKVSEHYIALCFVNGLEAYDGEINLAFDENLISNEYAVKLCLDYEVKKENKVVKKELIVSLKGELYFVKFIINLKEYDVKPKVIFGRSFMRLVNGIVYFGSGVITVYPEQDPFEDNSKKTEKSMDDWEQTSSSTGRHLTQEEVVKEALALRISQKFALLEEVRPVLETMTYNDKYKKVLDEIWKDKVELDGMIVKEEEEAINKVKGEASKEKDDPGAFIFPIRLEGKVNKITLADTGSDINTMSYQIYKQLGREDIKKVGVTIIIAKFLILDIPIDRDTPIVVGRGFLYTIGGVVNTPERLFSTLDGIYHQNFRVARFDVLRIEESDSDDKEEYEIKRNKFGAPIMTIGGNNDEAESSRSKHSRQYETVEEEYWLSISRKENLSLSRSHVSNIRSPVLRVIHKIITYGLYQRTNGYDKIQKNDLWLLSMFDARHQNEESWALSDEVLRSLSVLIYYRELDMTTLRELIYSKGRLIPEDPQPGVPRVGIPRPSRASM